MPAPSDNVIQFPGAHRPGTTKTPATIRVMIEGIARVNGVSPEELYDIDGNRSAHVSEVRRRVMRYLVFGEGINALAAGKMIGYKDHTSARFAIFGSKRGAKIGMVEQYATPICESFGVTVDFAVNTASKDALARRVRGEIVRAMLEDDVPAGRIALMLDVPVSTVNNWAEVA
jgi:hypothetical protein